MAVIANELKNYLSVNSPFYLIKEVRQVSFTSFLVVSTVSPGRHFACDEWKLNRTQTKNGKIIELILHDCLRAKKGAIGMRKVLELRSMLALVLKKVYGSHKHDVIKSFPLPFKPKQLGGKRLNSFLNFIQYLFQFKSILFQKVEIIVRRYHNVIMYNSDLFTKPL